MPLLWDPSSLKWKGFITSLVKGLAVLKAEEERFEEPQNQAWREQAESPVLLWLVTRKLSKAASFHQKAASSEQFA